MSGWWILAGVAGGGLVVGIIALLVIGQYAHDSRWRV